MLYLQIKFYTKIMTPEYELILKFPREIKIQCLKDALLKNDTSLFVGLSNVLLNAPLNAGGLESEIIEQIHKEHVQKLDTLMNSYK